MFIIYWLLATAALALSFYFHTKFLSRLKSHHARLYSQLGEPGVFNRYPIFSEFVTRNFGKNSKFNSFGKFMGQNLWLDLRDPQLEQYANIRKFFQLLMLVLFVAATFSLVSASY